MTNEKDLRLIWSGNTITPTGSHIIRFFWDVDKWLYARYDGGEFKKLYNQGGEDKDIICNIISTVYNTPLGKTASYFRWGSGFEMILSLYRWQTEDKIE